MAVAVIPIAVSVHTVVSWVFAMTVQPMWHSAQDLPFARLPQNGALQSFGLLPMVMALLWFYFTFSEYITTYYGGEPSHLAIFYSKLTGRFAPAFWVGDYSRVRSDVYLPLHALHAIFPDHFYMGDSGGTGAVFAGGSGARSIVHALLAAANDVRWKRMPIFEFTRFLLFACVAWTLACPLFGQEDGLRWFNNYKEALQEAKRTGKPLFLEFRCEP
ncbi:MAG: hypothetical protein JJE04_25650 [Acidobacteriia bacterium]|nr:hypothetical protein [Terriglobia bacterium]